MSDIPFERVEYNADHAQLDADKKSMGKGPAPKSGRHFELVNRMSELILKERYSPYAVLIQLNKKQSWPEGLTICEKTLYNWIESGDIPDVTIIDLPRKGKIKRRKGQEKPRKHNNVKYAERSISKRPEHINNREGVEHGEGNTVYSNSKGSKACLFVLTERKSRYEIIMKMEDRTAASVVNEFNKIEKRFGSSIFRKLFKSITFDNDVEFANVEELARSVFSKKTKNSLYYAHPYCSKERVSNENNNRLIRIFIPKETLIDDIKPKFMQKIEDWISN